MIHPATAGFIARFGSCRWMANKVLHLPAAEQPEAPADAAVQQGKKLHPYSVELLAALSGFAINCDLWQRRGVRGWAFSEELSYWGLRVDMLVPLAQAGLVWREDVRDPYRSNPFCIHRITQAGQNVLADVKGLPHVTIAQPADQLSEKEMESLYLSFDCWLGLEFLIRQDREQWFSHSDIATGSGRPFYTTDGDYLLRRNLVERKKLVEGNRRVYRTTDDARGARLIERNHLRAQVHFPGLRDAAARAQRGGKGSVSGG
jgi:hypothetical protein